MKTLTRFNIKEINISVVSLIEDKGKKQLYFSSKTGESFKQDIAEIQAFLDLAREHPGKQSCDFIFKHTENKDGFHLIFTGSLYTALVFLKEIDLESVQPAMQTIFSALKDPDEIEIRNALLETQTSSKKIQKSDNSKDKAIRRHSELSDETVPLLAKQMVCAK